jgi:HAD superfamily hydrolase (TIGR01509 family)
MIKAIIFDLNGVFIQSPKLSERFLNDYKVKVEDFLPALQGIMEKVRMPNAGNAFNYWKPYLEKWDVKLSEDQFFGYWFSAETENLELTDYAVRLKNDGVKLFILSNNFVERANYYKERFPFLEEIFEKIYYSWQTGFIKPDPAAFELLLHENYLQGNECLYFDDSLKNIETAKSFGINAYEFTGIDGIREKVNNFFYS